jgi:hypothetical protein
MRKAPREKRGYGFIVAKKRGWGGLALLKEGEFGVKSKGKKGARRGGFCFPR